MKQQTPRPPQERSKTKIVRHWIADWAVQLIVLLYCSTSIGWTCIVPTGSMENTLMVGDHLIVDRLAYAPAGKLTGTLLPYQEVQRGDIVVFRYPLDIRQNYVKRAIGIPGDHIRIVDKQVWRNGLPVSEPYKVLIPQQSSALPQQLPPNPGHPDRAARRGDAAGPRAQWRVGRSRGPVLRHGRQSATIQADSRFWGLVPRENIWGKPVLVFWSFEASTETLNNRTYWFDAALHFFTRTRWDHTMRLVRGDAAY